MIKDKPRTQVHFAKMSNKVLKELEKKSKASGLSRWLIAEKILESVLVNPKFNAKKWLKDI